MGENTTTMYVTKWWSTRGIVKLEGRLFGENFNSGYCFVKIGTDAFATEHEAQVRVRRAATKRLASLQGQAREVARIELYGVQVVDGLK